MDAMPDSQRDLLVEALRKQGSRAEQILDRLMREDAVVKSFDDSKGHVIVIWGGRHYLAAEAEKMSGRKLARTVVYSTLVDRLRRFEGEVVRVNVVKNGDDFWLVFTSVDYDVVIFGFGKSGKDALMLEPLEKGCAGQD